MPDEENLAALCACGELPVVHYTNMDVTPKTETHWCRACALREAPEWFRARFARDCVDSDAFEGWWATCESRFERMSPRLRAWLSYREGVKHGRRGGLGA